MTKKRAELCVPPFFLSQEIFFGSIKGELPGILFPRQYCKLVGIIFCRTYLFPQFNLS